MIQSIQEFIKSKKREELIDKLIELKTQPQTEDVKLLIQKIQQKMLR